jgi:hypothetical protein
MAIMGKICMSSLHFGSIHLSHASSNDVLNLETEAAGTQFAANATSKTALETLFDANRWMIFRNVRTNVCQRSTFILFVTDYLADIALGFCELAALRFNVV